METTGCHVTLMNAINQSGLMDKYNHGQRFKVIQVQKKRVISVEYISLCKCQVVTFIFINFAN